MFLSDFLQDVICVLNINEFLPIKMFKTYIYIYIYKWIFKNIVAFIEK